MYSGGFNPNSTGGFNPNSSGLYTPGAGTSRGAGNSSSSFGVGGFPSSTGTYVPGGSTQTSQGTYNPNVQQGTYNPNISNVSSNPSVQQGTYNPNLNFTTDTTSDFSYANRTSEPTTKWLGGPDTGFEMVATTSNRKSSKPKGTRRKNAKSETPIEIDGYDKEKYDADVQRFNESFHESKRGKTSYAMMLFKAKVNQIKMMQKRGFTIQLDELEIIKPGKTISDFIDHFYKKRRQLESYEKGQYGQSYQSLTFKQALSNKYEYPLYPKDHPNFYMNEENKDKKPCHVIFAETIIDPSKKNIKKITAKYASSFRNNSNKNDDFILIGDLALDSGTSKSFHDMNIQYFLYDDLLLNILDAILSPEYVIMTKGEVKDLLNNPLNNINNIQQLQHIGYKDAIVKFLGLKIGDVIKIIRTNYQIETLVQITIAYRLVTPAVFTMKPPKPKDTKKGKIDKDLEDEYGDEFTPDD